MNLSRASILSSALKANRLILKLVLCSCLLFSGHAFGQVLSGGLGDNFSNAIQIGTQGGTITQLAFDPNDPETLYVATWFGGIIRYDYAEDGTISNGRQAVDSSAGLDANGANGSYGIAFHNDPVLGSVMYLSRAMPNTPITPRGQSLGSIVRLTDTNGDGTWGNAGDVNQTFAENIFVADWTHQINQFAIHNNSLYVAIGSMTSNGGIINSSGDQRDPGESAHTGSVIFIEDLTVHSNDTTSTNPAWYDFPVVDGGVPLTAADIDVYQRDTQVFTSTAPGRFRVYSTGFRNNYGITVDKNGIVWTSENGGGQANASDNPPDALHQLSFQSDHSYPKGNIEVGDWKDPNNDNISAQVAQGAGYFQLIIDEVAADLGVGTAITGLAFIDANGNDFDGHIAVARHSNSGQDVVLVDPVDGSFQNLLDRVNGQRPTDVVVDPFGNLVLSYSTDQLRHITVAQEAVISEPEPELGIVYTVGIDFGSTPSSDPNTTWNDIVSGGDAMSGGVAAGAGRSIANLNDTTNSPTGVSFTLTNNTGFNAWDFENGNTGDGGLINDESVFSDGLLSNDARGQDRDTTALQDYFEVTFSGLDDSLVYDFVGGYARSGNNNFNGVWFVDATVTGGAIDLMSGTSFITDAQNDDTSDDYATFTGLTTDGAGNLTILMTGEASESNPDGDSAANQAIIAAVTLTAVNTGSSAGDFNDNGVVDCDDLNSFVGNLQQAATGALAQLDLNNDDQVTIADATLHITTLVETSNGQVGTFFGDLDCDGVVDVLGDAFALIGNLGNAVTSYSQGDINFDGTVTVLGDAFLLIGNLGNSNSNQPNL